MGGSFIIGALLSASAGWCGMMVATDGNVRTTVACTKGTLNDGLRVAFTAGSVMGFTVVGLGLFGLGITFWMLQVWVQISLSPTLDPSSPVQPSVLITQPSWCCRSGLQLWASSVPSWVSSLCP